MPAVTTSCHSTPVFMTFHFSAECTLLRRLPARSKPTRAMRSISRGVDGRIDGALLAVLERDDLLGLAEVGAARQLAQDQDVEPLHELALERGGLSQRRIADRGTQVGEEVEVLAQAAGRLRAMS